MKNKKRKAIAMSVIALIIIVAIITIIIVANKPKRQITEQINLGNRYLSELDYENAVLAYSNALEIDSLNQDARNRLETAYIEWASALYNDGDYETALRRIDEARNKLSDTDALLDTEIDIMTSMANHYLDTNDFDSALMVADKIKEIDPAKAEKLISEIESRKTEYNETILAAAKEQLKEYEPIIELSKEALSVDEIPTDAVIPGEVTVSESLYITFTEAKKVYGDLIGKLESYIAFLEENQIDELYTFKKEIEMKDSAYEMSDDIYEGIAPATVNIDGVNAIPLGSAYNILIKCYLKTGDMENALRIRQKLAAFIEDESILTDHAFKEGQTLDQYGREIRTELNNNSRTIEYGEAGLCIVHIKSTNGVSVVEDNSVFEDGRIVEHDFTDTGRDSTNVGQYEYSYADNSVNITIQIKGDFPTSVITRTYEINKYGSLQWK